MSKPTFQSDVYDWLIECFGRTIASDKTERADRYTEETLELLQSVDYPIERILALISYVYGRDKGEPKQETGGVMVTLAAFCTFHGIDMDDAAKTELARVWTKIEAIRAKQAAKPTGSALPVAIDPTKAFAEWINAGPALAQAVGAEFDLKVKTACQNNLRLTSAPLSTQVKGGAA